MRIEGTTQLLGFFEVLQIAELNRRHYSIRIIRPGEEGIIALSDGVLRHAALGSLAGAEAVTELSGWADSQLEITPLSSAPPANIAPNRDLLLNLATKAVGRQAPSPPNPSWRVKGDLELMPAAEVLQVFELNKQPVHVSFVSDKGSASVFLSGGEAIHASLAATGPSAPAKAALPPEEIILDVLTWTGTFEVSVAESLPERTIRQPITTLILDGIQRAEERSIFTRERIVEEQAAAQKTQRDVEEGNASEGVKQMVAKRYLARGRMAPINTLIGLAQDPDVRVKRRALDSISDLPPVLLKTLAEDTETPDAILRHLAEEFWDEDEIMRPLAENKSASEETLGFLASNASDAVLAILMKDAARVARSAAMRAGIANRGDRASRLRRKQELEARKKGGGSIHKRILDMSMADKIFLAYRGSASERAILAQNPLRTVAIAVLDSPKVTAGEVESLASMKSVNGELLEEIAGNPVWVNQYPIARAVTTNPKTPTHISIDLLKRIREADLKQISKDRNLPEGLRASAQRRLQNIQRKKSI